MAIKLKAATRSQEEKVAFKHEVLPRICAPLLASSRRKLKPNRADGARDLPAAVSDALKLAGSWTHAGSLWQRSMELDLDGAAELRSGFEKQLSSLEPEGIVQKVRYLRKFLAWAAEQGVDCPSAAAPHVVSRFLASLRPCRPTVQRSYWIAFRWAVKYLALGVDLTGVERPRAGAAHAAAEDGQAAPAPPDLLRRIDVLFRDTVAPGGELPRLLAGALMMVASWMRFRHLQRAFPISLTNQVLWLFVTKGKRPDATGERRGYRIGVPRRSALGADIGRYIWDNWHSYAASLSRPSPGLLRDDCGGLLSLVGFNTGVQRVLAMANAVADVTTVTSYSWRRGTDAVGEARGLDPHELAALGSWRPSSGAGSSSSPSMPLRYAGDRLAGAAAARVVHIRVLRHVYLRAPYHKILTWETLRRLLLEIDQDKIRREVAADFEADQVECELAEGIVPGLSRPKVITAIPMSKAPVGEAPLVAEALLSPAVHEDGRDDGDQGSSLFDTDMACSWIIPKSSSGKLHIAVASSTGPEDMRWRCTAKQRKKFVDPVAFGTGLMEGITSCQLLDRSICESCLQAVCPEARVRLEALRYA